MAHTFHLFYVCLYKFSLVLPLLLLKDTNNVQIKSISDYIKRSTKLGYFITHYKLYRWRLIVFCRINILHLLGYLCSKQIIGSDRCGIIAHMFLSTVSWQWNDLLNSLFIEMEFTYFSIITI